MSMVASRAPGAVVDERFELESLLGSGGMGQVWGARDLVLERRVALKFLRDDLDVEATARIEREALATARVDDPRIVTVLDLRHPAQGSPYLVLEALDGRTLADLLRDGPLPSARFERLVHDLVGGLAAAHDAGVLHQDIKPSNVLVAQDAFRIADFGIASFGDEPMTDGEIVGTPVYVAPERFAGASATPRSDVFATAAVLHEALSGVQPFRGSSTEDSVRRLRAGVAHPLPPRVPSHVIEAIEQALQLDPERRPATAGAFLEQLVPASVDPAAHARGDETESLPVDDTGTRTLVLAPDETATMTVDPQTDPPRAAATPVPPRDTPAPPRDTPADRARRAVSWGRDHPAAVFTAVGAVLLVLLFVAASLGSADTSTGDPESSPEDNPEAQLDDVLDRIEQLGR